MGPKHLTKGVRKGGLRATESGWSSVHMKANLKIGGINLIWKGGKAEQSMPERRDVNYRDKNKVIIVLVVDEDTDMSH